MVPFLATVLCCLFWSLEYGMLVGIVVNALFILRKSMTPQFQLETLKVTVTNSRIYRRLQWWFIYLIKQHNNVELSVAEIKGNVDYTASEYLKSAIVAHVTEQMGAVTLVVIKGAEISSIDATVALVSNRTHSKFAPSYTPRMSRLHSHRALFHYAKIWSCCTAISSAGIGILRQLASFVDYRKRRAPCLSSPRLFPN